MAAKVMLLKLYFIVSVCMIGIIAGPGDLLYRRRGLGERRSGIHHRRANIYIGPSVRHLSPDVNHRATSIRHRRPGVRREGGRHRRPAVYPRRRAVGHRIQDVTHRRFGGVDFMYLADQVCRYCTDLNFYDCIWTYCYQSLYGYQDGIRNRYNPRYYRNDRTAYHGNNFTRRTSFSASGSRINRSRTRYSGRDRPTGLRQRYPDRGPGSLLADAVCAFCERLFFYACTLRYCSNPSDQTPIYPYPT